MLIASCHPILQQIIWNQLQRRVSS